MTISARERLETCLERIADPAGDGKRVFTRIYAEEARIAAVAADARTRYGHALGPLDGRIVSLKDMIDVAGEPTQAGCAAYRDAPPAARDAEVVRRLRAAGAVIIGKTNMTELAFSGLGINAYTGTPANPHDGARIPGGSSSGAAVAVARGMCDIAIGTDTGGSTRIPAAFCGIAGYKPSQRRVPRAGVMDLSATLDSVGPLAAGVADIVLADAVMAGEAPRAASPRGVEGLRLALPLGSLFQNLDEPVSRAFEAAVARLLKAGARIVDIDIEPLMQKIDAIYAIGSIAAIEAAHAHGQAVRDRPGEIDRRVLSRIRGGMNVLAPDYVRMLDLRSRVIAEARALFAPFDALLLPTVAMVAPLLAPLDLDDALYASTNHLALRNTSQFNMLDCCAISLPLPEAGALPVGLMLVAVNGQDEALLDVAAGVEALLKG